MLISWRKKKKESRPPWKPTTKPPNLLPAWGRNGARMFLPKHPNGEQTAESKHQKPHRTPNRLHHSAAYDSQKALPELPLSEPPSCKWLPPARRGVETDRTPPSDCRSQTIGQFNEIFNMGMNQNLRLFQKLAG